MSWLHKSWCLLSRENPWMEGEIKKSLMCSFTLFHLETSIDEISGKYSFVTNHNGHHSCFSCWMETLGIVPFSNWWKLARANSFFLPDVFEEKNNSHHCSQHEIWSVWGVWGVSHMSLHQSGKSRNLLLKVAALISKRKRKSLEKNMNQNICICIAASFVLSVGLCHTLSSSFYLFTFSLPPFD